MASNYKGIIFDNLKGNQQRNSTYKTNFERSQEALEEARKEYQND